MKKKKLLLLLALIASMKSLALEGSVTTNISLSPEFTKITGNSEENISERKIFFNKFSFSSKFLELNLKEKNVGIDFNLTLKSSRADARLNDWQLDSKNAAYPDERNKNHDLMGLVELKYTSKEFNNFTNETNFKYYLDDILSIRSLDKKTNNVEDNSVRSEYINEDGSKDAAGNMKFDTRFKGKVKNVEIDTNLEYKANQFVRFNVSPSYFKTNFTLNSDITDKNRLEFNHNFNYDLSFSTKPFDTLNNDLDEYPDYLDGNFVKRFKNNLSLNYYNKFTDNKDDKLGAKFNYNVESFLVAGDNYTNPVTTYYNIHKPGLEIYLEKELIKGLTIRPSFSNDFTFKHAKYLKQGDLGVSSSELWAGYYPKFSFETNYTHTLKEDNKLSYKNISGYKQDLTLSPVFTSLDKIKHTLFSENVLNVDYNINKNNKTNFSLEYNLDFPIQDKLIKPITSNLVYKANFENTDVKNLVLSANINGKFEVNSLFKTLNPETIRNEFSAEVKSKYTILENEKNNELLTLNNSLKYSNNTSFNYYILDGNKTVPTYTEKGAEDGFYKGELKYIYGNGNLKAVDVLNTIEFKNNVNYKKNLNEKLELNSSLDLDSKIDFLAIRLEKKHTYKDKMPEDKVEIEVFDDFNKKVNIGGSINIKPSTALTYKIKDNLTLDSKLSADILFERKVVDKVRNSKRPDNGSYNYIDKKFEFKKLVPKVELNLNYKW